VVQGPVLKKKSKTGEGMMKRGRYRAILFIRFAPWGKRGGTAQKYKSCVNMQLPDRQINSLGEFPNTAE